MEYTIKKCAFTGHREVGTELDEKLLKRVVERLVKRGTQTFYCGMARGFDLIAADCVLSLKRKYDVKLVACVPYEGQGDSFYGKEKERYARVLSACDEVNVLSPRYYNGCMQARDRYMVDHCDGVVCFLRENRGGTYYTVNYAKKKNLPVIEV